VSRLLRAAAVVAAGLALAGCGSEGRIAEGEGDRTEGKELFTQRCGSCHVLADAGSVGTIGPNLDEAFRYARDEKIDHQGFEESTIRDVVRGQISYPVEDPVTEQQGMPGIDTTLPECEEGKENEPAGCVENQDEAADSIAVYVAAVAGLPVQGGGDGGGGETDGKAIFASAGCGGCHVLEAAGSSGTIGPNLDDAKPSVDLAITRVTDGKGQMPAFKDRLSEAQIKAVAEFVAENAGK
jgi:mono/diheme cytochrome c family protein